MVIESNNILEIKNLYINFETLEGTSRVLDDINLKVEKSEVVGLVGETGCGKTVTVKTLLNILPIPPAKIEKGKIIFCNQDLLELPKMEREKFLKGKVAYIPQNVTTSLNPVYKIGEILTDVIKYAGGCKNRGDYQSYEIELLKRVNIPNPEAILECYPFQLSGGMKQRILIAISLVIKPNLLVADEPTTALDVTIQKGFLNLLLEKIQEEKMACIYITHNLGIARKICNKIYVIYAGNIVEYVYESSKLFDKPYHPYTKALISSIPRIRGEKVFQGIQGDIPDYLNPPSGCRFHPRCQNKLKVCSIEKPELVEVESLHFVACHLFNKKRG